MKFGVEDRRSIWVSIQKGKWMQLNRIWLKGETSPADIWVMRIHTLCLKNRTPVTFCKDQLSLTNPRDVLNYSERALNK